MPKDSRLSQLVAMTACEDCPAVENGDPATTAPSWAEKPMTDAANVAGCGIERDRIAFGLPFAAAIPLAIVQVHAPRL